MSAYIADSQLSFAVSDDKIGPNSSGLERDLASATPPYSPIIFAQNEWVGILM